MNRFQVSTEKRDDQLVYVLTDAQQGACARILPGIGANCMELKLVPAADAAPVSVIDDMQYIARLPEMPSRFGIPVLFPWPSGIPEGEFKFGDRVTQLNPPGERRGRQHGFVSTAPWRVLRSDCDNEAAWLTCSIDSDQCGEIAERFGYPCTLEITWRLTADGLEMLMTARNTGTAPMPVGLGLHPYFTVPFGKAGSRQQCRLQVDADRQWNLDTTMSVQHDEPPPTQLYLETPDFDATPDGGRALADTSFNHVYRATFDKQKKTTAAIYDRENGLRLTVHADKDFGCWVIYSPPDRPAMSLEPWTMVPNAFNLAALGVEGTGTITVQPGEQWQGRVSISLKEIG